MSLAYTVQNKYICYIICKMKPALKNTWFVINTVLGICLVIAAISLGVSAPLTSALTGVTCLSAMLLSGYKHGYFKKGALRPDAGSEK